MVEVAVAVTLLFFGGVGVGMAKNDRQWGPQESLKTTMPKPILDKMTPEMIKAMEDRKRFRRENSVARS